MELEKGKLHLLIKKSLKEFNYFGLISIYYNNELIINQNNGYKDLINKIKYQKNDLIRIEKYNSGLINILLLKILEKNKIDLNTPINNYLKELKHDNITFLNLLRDNTGLKDFYSEKILEEHKKEEYKILDENSKNIFDINYYNKKFDIKILIDFYNNDLNHKPGSKVDYINISQILGNKLIEIIENKSYEKS